jgi:hypothetical protein
MNTADVRILKTQAMYVQSNNEDRLRIIVAVQKIITYLYLCARSACVYA